MTEDELRRGLIHPHGYTLGASRGSYVIYKQGEAGSWHVVGKQGGGTEPLPGNDCFFSQEEAEQFLTQLDAAGTAKNFAKP